jgi:mannan polymerase II complex MNN10 subunit
MRDFLKSEDPFAKHAVTIPQWKINAFPEEIHCFDKSEKGWEHGTFVIHFAGAWAHVPGDDPTGDLMTKYESQIMWGPNTGEEVYR